MNIIEAIKSGRRFRRRCWDNQYWLCQDDDNVRINISRADVKADDWEIEQTSVTITREEFDAAFEKLWNAYAPVSRDLLAKELGL